jgi:hypothetical protein
VKLNGRPVRAKVSSRQLEKAADPLEARRKEAVNRRSAQRGERTVTMTLRGLRWKSRRSRVAWHCPRGGRRAILEPETAHRGPV